MRRGWLAAATIAFSQRDGIFRHKAMIESGNSDFRHAAVHAPARAWIRLWPAYCLALGIVLILVGYFLDS
jgi:hypothetical protein